jgi:hypothetical protein
MNGILFPYKKFHYFPTTSTISLQKGSFFPYIVHYFLIWYTFSRQKGSLFPDIVHYFFACNLILDEFAVNSCWVPAHRHVLGFLALLFLLQPLLIVMHRYWHCLKNLGQDATLHYASLSMSNISCHNLFLAETQQRAGHWSLRLCSAYPPARHLREQTWKQLQGET